MNQVIYFFKHLLDVSDWPPRWQCGKWSEFHGWLYIVSDLIIWLSYFIIPLAIIKYISRRHDARFIRLYFLFAAFILACGTTHFLDAIAFWYPAYRLSALMRFITAVVSVTTVFYLIKYLPAAFSLKTGKELQAEINLRKEAEEKLVLLNNELEKRVAERTGELEKSLREIAAYKEALDESSIIAITDQKGIIFHVNDNFCRVSKYSREELIGQDHRIINSGFHPKEFIRNLWGTIANGNIWKGELKNKAKDGSSYWVDTTIVPFMNEAGKPFQYVAIRNDITERKLAEEKLSLTMQQLADYKYALDETAMVAITDKNKKRIYVNDAFCKTLGYSQEELLGEDFIKFNRKYNSDEVISDLYTTIDNGKIWHGELRVADKQGNLHWFDNTCVPFLDEEGNPYQFLVIRTDITERKKAEEKLAITQQQLSDYKYALDETAMVAIVDWSKTVLYVNDNFCKTYGYNRDELIGKSFIAFNTQFNSKEVVMDLLKTVDSGKIWRGELQGMDKEGNLHWFDSTTVPFLDEQGKPYQFLVIRRDITQRKEAEKQVLESEQLYRTIASSIPGSMVALFDKHCRYLLAEGDLFDKIGYKKETLLGNKAQDVLHPELYDSVEKNFERAFTGKAFDIESKREGFELFTKYIPLHNKEGEVYRVLVTSLDVSALKKAQHELKQLNNELEQKVEERTAELNATNKELESFSYSVSHDLRAPLRAISGYTQIIEEEYRVCLDVEGARLIYIIQNSANQMGVLIDDLLSFSRLGKKDLQKSLIDMNELVQSVIEEIQTTSHYQANIEISNLAPVFADRSLIKQVLINFISNAFKYSSKTPVPTITISSSREDDNIVYAVEDNGVGFEPQYAHKLFQVFERLHANEDFEGTGVGLAIVKRIIDKHVGQVWAKGEAGKGAKFYFSLPSH